LRWDAVFIDQAVPGQLRNEPAAAEDDQVAAGLPLVAGDLVDTNN